MTLSLAMSMGLTSVQSPPATAAADDTTPDAFDFTPVTGADRSTLYVSNTVTISGINAASPVTVSGGQYRKNGGSWTSTPGEVVNGDVLQVRGTSSGSYLTPVNVTLTVGGVSDTFTITTAAEAPDTTPDTFSFTDVADAERSTVYTSNVVTIAGINAAAAVSVTGGEYRKNGGAWTTSAGTVVAGDTLQVRGTSSASYTADVNVTLTVGGVADTYTITTKADPVAVSEIQSVAIMDATRLDATGAYGDGASRPGINGEGWVGKIVMPLQIGQTFDPSKIVHEVTDPGYDATGTTTVTRQIRGAIILRRQYNAAASKQQSDNGVVVTIYYALEDFIYGGSTLTKVTADAGYYGSLQAGTVGTIANDSERPYPKPLACWVNTQHERSGTSGMYVELSAVHAHGRNGRMVARVEYTATDASSHTSATVVSAAPALSMLQTQGNIAEVYPATVPLTALTQGDLCQVNAKIYPWIGDASAVLDLAVDGFAWPTSNPLTPLRFLNDKAGTYGGAIAYVRQGAAGPGVVSRTDATAKASPFPTLALASAALATFNNANSTPAHNDHSGSTILLMDNGSGGAVAHTIAASIATAAGHCWTHVRRDPSATGAVSILMDNTRAVPDKFKFFVDITHSAGSGFDGGSGGLTKMLAFGGGTITTTLTGNTPALNHRNGLTYLSNVTVVSADSRQSMFDIFGANHTQVALALGVVCEENGTDGKMFAHAAIGCRFKRTACQELDPATYPTWSSQDARFIVNCWFRNVVSMATFNGFGSRIAYEHGLAFVQNLVETTAATVGLAICADGTTLPCNNVVVAYNTIVGGRFNHMYADVVGAVDVLKRAMISFNLVGDTWNVKTDTFTNNTTATGRVGNWETRHSVGNRGNVCINGTANFASTPSPTSWFGDHWQNASYFVGAGAVTFADDKSLPVGAGAGSGTYALTGAENAAYDQVPAGLAMLKFDIAGRARLNNAAGASGCYEREAA